MNLCKRSDYINNNGTGAPYVSAEKIITRNITGLNFTSTIDTKRIEIIVNTGKPVDPRRASSPASPEKMDFKGVVILRNSN